jgi:hypothetical protein
VSNQYSETLKLWIMDGVSVDQVLFLDDTNRYSQVASGDFNRNGNPEILDDRRPYRRQRRHEIVDGEIDWSDSYSAYIDSSWVPVGVGDHHGDGADDLVWLDRDTGVLEVWTWDAERPTRDRVDLGVPPGAEVTGSGDYDGDGRAEIAVREESPGGVSIWFMDGARVLDVVPVLSLSENWGLAGVGGEAPEP